MAMPGIMAQEFSVPPIADSMKNKNEYSNYSVKYFKADMDDLVQMAELQVIMTRGIAGSGDVLILKEESFVFMSQRFICVQYLEKNDN